MIAMMSMHDISTGATIQLFGLWRLHLPPSLVNAHQFVVCIQNDCGMLRVDAQQLKAALLPSPTSLLARLGQILPSAAVRMYNIFIEQLHGATSLLKTSIANVEEYVQKLSFLEECKVRMDLSEGIPQLLPWITDHGCMHSAE